MSIRDHLLNRKDKDLTNVQAKMDSELVTKVRKQMKKDKVATWNEFFEACFRSYLEDSERKEKERADNGMLPIGKDLG